jgi:hypothetical protein
MKIDKNHCAGCRNDFYNHGSNSTTGNCWSLDTAKMVWRIPVGNWERPPYLHKKKVKVPNCKHSESGGTHFVDPARISKTGYWQYNGNL